MSERIQLFDLELKISFKFDIETRADHNLRFRDRIERLKRTNHSFFHDRKQKTNWFRSQKNETLTSLQQKTVSFLS
jgi:hypothetical protein